LENKQKVVGGWRWEIGRGGRVVTPRPDIRLIMFTLWAGSGIGTAEPETGTLWLGLLCGFPGRRLGFGFTFRLRLYLCRFWVTPPRGKFSILFAVCDKGVTKYAPNWHTLGKKSFWKTIHRIQHM